MKLLTLLIIIFLIMTGWETSSVTMWMGFMLLGCWIAD